MTLKTIRNLRHQINTVFYKSCDYMRDEDRLAFANLLEEVDAMIRKTQEFEDEDKQE